MIKINNKELNLVNGGCGSFNFTSIWGRFSREEQKLFDSDKMGRLKLIRRHMSDKDLEDFELAFSGFGLYEAVRLLERQGFCWGEAIKIFKTDDEGFVIGLHYDVF